MKENSAFGPHHAEALCHFYQTLSTFYFPQAIDWEKVLGGGSPSSDTELAYAGKMDAFLDERDKARTCEAALELMHPADVKVLRIAYSVPINVPSTLVAFAGNTLAPIMVSLSNDGPEALRRLCQLASAKDKEATRRLKSLKERAERMFKLACVRFASAWELARSERRPNRPFEGWRGARRA